MNEELLPCPFCGEKDASVTTQYVTGQTAVVCEVCTAMGPWDETEASAIAAWNRRPAPRELSCDGCRHEHLNDRDYPCRKCTRAGCGDFYKTKGGHP